MLTTAGTTWRRWALAGRAYVEEDADTRVALGRYRSVLRELAPAGTA